MFGIMQSLELLPWAVLLEPKEGKGDPLEGDCNNPRLRLLGLGLEREW